MIDFTVMDTQLASAAGGIKQVMRIDNMCILIDQDQPNRDLVVIPVLSLQPYRDMHAE